MKSIMHALLGAMERGEDCVLVTLVESIGSTPRGAGAQMLVGTLGRLCGTVGGGTLERQCEEHSRALRSERRSDFCTFALRPDGINMVCGGEVTVHFQFIGAQDALWRQLAADAAADIEAHRKARLVLREDGGVPALSGEDGAFLRAQGRIFLPLTVGERAVIFGAGHVAQSLCPLLRSVGFYPVVFDDRAELAREELFPAAEKVICGDFSCLSRYLTITEEDYLVVMTSGHLNDLAVEQQLLQCRFAYLGVIGSKRKTLAVNEQLRARGITDEQLARVHTPIGLPIGAVTPAEIAVSVAGEMIAVRARRRGEIRHLCPMR